MWQGNTNYKFGKFVSFEKCRVATPCCKHLEKYYLKNIYQSSKICFFSQGKEKALFEMVFLFSHSWTWESTTFIGFISFTKAQSLLQGAHRRPTITKFCHLLILKSSEMSAKEFHLPVECLNGFITRTIKYEIQLLLSLTTPVAPSNWGWLFAPLLALHMLI